MPKYTNISDGPRGIHTDDGLVMVNAGQTVDVMLAANESPVEDWFAKAGTTAAKETTQGEAVEAKKPSAQRN